MNRKYDIDLLYEDLMKMSIFCENAIACAAISLFESDRSLVDKVRELEIGINNIEAVIDNRCNELIKYGELDDSRMKSVIAAQNMVSEMERVGDRALDIAEMSLKYTNGTRALKRVPLEEMAESVVSMFNDSVDAFVETDVNTAKFAIDRYDKINQTYYDIRKISADNIKNQSMHEEIIFNTLIIAKYFDHIGDRAGNIAKQVIYSIEG